MPFLYTVAMSVESAHEDDFNALYDTEHLPDLASVTGVLAAARYRRIPCESVAADGSIQRTVPSATDPTYVAVYTLERPDIVTGSEWLAARSRGNWRSIQPFTSNNRRAMFEAI